MPRDSKRSYQEMDAILKRSAELQARRGSTEFSEHDVLDAAKELGIDAQTAAEVVETHLARRATAAELVPRPFNTRIQLEVSPDVLSLTIPPVRLSGPVLAPLVFSGVWLSFIAFWTWGASHGSVVFALFSVPFWLVGLSMLGKFGLPLIRTTTLTLNRDGGELVVSPVGRRREIRTQELRVRIDNLVQPNQNSTQSAQKSPQVLMLEHGVDTYPLMFGYSPQEQRWIASELRAWLQNA